MLTTQIPSKETPEYLDQVIGNADTGQSSKKTRTYTLGSILNSMIVSILSTTSKTIVGAINELFDIVNFTDFTQYEIANEVFHAQLDPIDIDEIYQSDINNIFN